MQSPEVKPVAFPQYSPIKLTIPIDASTDFQTQAELLQRALDNFSIMYTWSNHVQSNSFLHDMGTDFAHIRGLGKNTRWLLQTGSMFPANSEYFHPIQTQHSQTKDLYIPTSEELHILRKKLRQSMHEVGNSIFGFEPILFTKKGEEYLQQKLTILTEKIIHATELLNDFYPVEELSVDFVIQLFWQQIQDHLRWNSTESERNMLRFETNIDVFGMMDVILWNPHWITSLAENIALNAKKAYININPPHRLTLHAYSENSLLHMMVDDNGPGFTTHLLTNGFHDGYTYWGNGAQGTGTGLAHHADVLARYYGGSLLPQQVIDENGLLISGARLHTQIPITLAT